MSGLVAATGFDSARGGRNPRAHLLDDIWLLTIFTMLVAVAVPWFAGDLHAELGTASLGLLALGALHLGFNLLATPATRVNPWRRFTLRVLHALGVVALAFIWQHVGGFQNPLLLMVFALPVIGSIFLSRWHPYWTAVLSIGVVAASALAQAPELRAYVGSLVGGDAWLSVLYGAANPPPPGAFPGFFAPSRYLVLILEVFAVAMCACAVAAEYLGAIFERLTDQGAAARVDADENEALWADIIEQMPVAALLVDPDLLRIVAYSRSVLRYLKVTDSDCAGRRLFDLVEFSYADLIQDLIAGEGRAEPTLATMRVGDETYLAQIRVAHVVHRRRRLALLTLEDATEGFCLRAALDTSDSALLVIDARGHIKAYNRLAARLFGGIRVGAPASELPAAAAGGTDWWDPGVNQRRKLHLEIGSRIYEVACAVTDLPGEAESLYSVSLSPLAAADTADPWSLSHETGARLRNPTPYVG